MKNLFLALMLIPVVAFGWIHPDTQAAIDADQDEDSIIVDGVKQFTGYHPTLEQYKDAHFKRVKVRTSTAIPEELDYSMTSFSPVRRQVNGDCWAQGGVTALQLTVNFIDKTRKLFSVQDVIDCSGFGTARNGGELSMKHFEKGATYEADYPYNGRDNRCRSDVTRREKVKRAFFLRGSSGGMPTVQEVQTALMDYGAMEVCGASGALGSGGWVDSPRRGVVDHCYGLVGWKPGKKYGHKDTLYWKIENSWGTSWGEQGYGMYAISQDGIHFTSQVLTEFQGVEYKPMVPPTPVEFTVESKDASLRAVVQPGTDYSVDDAKHALETALKSLGG